MIDDLDGDQADETITFGVGGRAFEIDLSEANAARLREVFAPLVQAGRRRGSVRGAAVAASKPRGSTTAGREQSQAVRDWARANGLEVADKGRISGDVLAKFQAAH
jgi:hypothetical protein